MFEIASDLHIPISIDEATRNRIYGHYARILVDVDLTEKLHEDILIERDGFAFFVYIEYEKIPSFCTHCPTTGHYKDNCKKLSRKDNNMKKDVQQGITSKVTDQKANEEDLKDSTNKVDSLDENLVVKDTPVKEGKYMTRMMRKLIQFLIILWIMYLMYPIL